MITNEELLENGFVQCEYDKDEYYHEDNPKTRYTLDNGEITFVRENDNYHGVNVSGTDTIKSLLIFKMLIGK